jgi:hypothetical protein
MKKLAFALLFLLSIIEASAQEASVGNYGFKLGLTASPNFGFGKVEEGKGNGSALGFSYGLIGDFNFAENYAFSTGLTIITINTKVTELLNPPSALLSSTVYTGPKAEWNMKYKMQYVEIPLTIKLKTSNINGVRWFGQFGLSNDIRIGSRLDTEVKAESYTLKDQDWSKHTRAYRAGMIIGGGGEFELNGKTSLLLGLMLNNGFTNISEDSKVRNHYVGINFGIFF